MVHKPSKFEHFNHYFKHKFYSFTWKKTHLLILYTKGKHLEMLKTVLNTKFYTFIRIIDIQLQFLPSNSLESRVEYWLLVLYHDLAQAYKPKVKHAKTLKYD